MDDRSETMANIIEKLVKLDYGGLTIIHAGAMVLENYQRLEQEEKQCGQQEKVQAGLHT